MPNTTRQIAICVSAMLLLTIISQLFYTATLQGVGLIEGWPMRSTIWTIELLLFTSIAIASLVGLIRSSTEQLGWATLVVAGLTNMLQSGIGLSMFVPATEAGPEFAPLMSTVLAGSFLFYFLAKAVLGLTAVLFGISLFSKANMVGRALGLISVIAGVIAIALNVLAVHLGLGAVPLAGLSGATATFFAGCTIWFSVRKVEQVPETIQN